MKRFLPLLLALLICPALVMRAQTPSYEQMCSQLDSHSLPLVNLTVDLSQVTKATYINGAVEITDPERRTDPNTMTTRFDCLVKYRGANSLNYDKKCFALKLVDAAGEQLDANIFGIREENSWILDAMAIDRIRMRNRLCFDCWNEISRTPYDTQFSNRNGTEGVFVELFINGAYHGLYCMTDKIDRKLLGLKKARVDGEGNVEVRGLLYKGISWGSADNLLSYNRVGTSGTVWNAWELKYPDDYPSAATWQPMMDLIDFCSSATPNADFTTNYPDYFYLGNLVDYMVFTLALNVGDNAYKNTYLSTVNIGEGHRYLITPWDMDMSLGGLWNGDYDESLSSTGRYNQVAPFNRMWVLNIDNFRTLIRESWQQLAGTLFAERNIFSRLDSYADAFEQSGAWKREVERWSGNPVALKDDLNDELDYVKQWYTKNYDYLCRQLNVTAGITDVTTSVPRQAGIYTLDGRRVKGDVGSLPRGLYIVDGKKMVVR